MAYDQEENIYSILQHKDKNPSLAEHLKFLGFREIIGMNKLNLKKTQKYLKKIVDLFYPFERFVDKEIIMRNSKLIDNKILTYNSLALSDKYHLSIIFKIIGENELEFICDECDGCDILEKGGLPHIYLIKNIPTKMNYSDGDVLVEENNSGYIKAKYITEKEKVPISEESLELIKKQYSFFEVFLDEVKA